MALDQLQHPQPAQITPARLHMSYKSNAQRRSANLDDSPRMRHMTGVAPASHPRPSQVTIVWAQTLPSDARPHAAPAAVLLAAAALQLLARATAAQACVQGTVRGKVDLRRGAWAAPGLLPPSPPHLLAQSTQYVLMRHSGALLGPAAAELCAGRLPADPRQATEGWVHAACAASWPCAAVRRQLCLQPMHARRGVRRRDRALLLCWGAEEAACAAVWSSGGAGRRCGSC